MPDDGSRTHLGAFLPFRDELEPLFGFFARFSTRAGAPVSLDGADASAGMVSRAAALSPRKNKHPLPGYPYPPLRPSRRARRRGDNFAPRVRPPRDLDLRAGAALVDCALEGRGSLGKIAFSTLSFARRVGSSAQVDSRTGRRFSRRREFSAGGPSSHHHNASHSAGASAARVSRRARVRGRAATDHQRGRVTRGSSDAASLLGTLLRSNATPCHGVAVRARPGDARLRRRRGGARHADDRRALPDRRRVRSRLPVRRRVRLGLEPRRVRGRRLPRRARGRSRPRSAHVGGSRLRAPAVRRVARSRGSPLARARGLRPRRRLVRQRVAAHARARGAAHAGVLRRGRPGRARNRSSGHRGKEDLRRRVRARAGAAARGRERFRPHAFAPFATHEPTPGRTS